MSSLPSIQPLHSQKPSRSISFKLAEARGKCTTLSKRPSLGETRKLRTEDVSNIGIHGNTAKDTKTMRSFEGMIGDLGKNEQQKLPKSQKGLVSGPQMYSEKDKAVVYRHVVQSLHGTVPSNGPSKSNANVQFKRSNDVNVQLSKMLREKDREISKMREIIRKASLDRENATCADANSRMHVTELKHKLSNQKRDTEHVTTVERLRCKEKVNNETERLRHERDDARAQLAHDEKLVWQLRKQVEQLGYLSRQRYKTIQELSKKMAAKDKSVQEMRKRLEQAQLIAIPGTSERRNSVSVNSEHKNLKWETPSRLTTVNKYNSSSALIQPNR